ncbi:WD repeat-containing protein 26 [Verticillium nonalfalfae]|uniref:WD repeat-containing protein 26 n=1 Tax=Verticillium nonalfalfae TaxID=1051616 RepID=A0A3M9YKJ1_9PEZI|nr:WD repeat-containing protein 26 [Verticillium nonalfalfae]RNJ60521.1 WD repeat-containing protein 26 [Verticillium nonalfalfae]
MPADDDARTSNGTSRPSHNGASTAETTTSSANGIYKAAIATNGSSAASRLASSSYHGHDKEEVTRILIQTLADMGYQSAAESLSHDSGFQLESKTVGSFRTAIIDGVWDVAEELLSGAAASGDRGQQGNGLVLASGSNPSLMRFWIRQQKFLELLESKHISQALVVLRTELTPLYQDTQKLHMLSSLLMCTSTEDLRSKSGWDGSRGNSRRELLSELSIMIWEVPSFNVVRTLGDHVDGCANLAWSPDDSMIVTCGRDKHARLWDTKSGHLLKKIGRLAEPVSGCVWAPDGQSFVVSSLDKEHSIQSWSVDGELICDWAKKHRVQDVCGSADGHWLVAVDDSQSIHIYNAVTRKLECTMKLDSRPTSVSISVDSRHLLVNKQNDEAQLIDLIARKPVQKFIGHTGGACLIRSAFGGANESFVVSGSEDGSILIWHKNSGVAVERLQGHSPRTNAVVWNPTDPCMIASCGDEGVIKM